jgi:uncharacterized protein (TIGR00369 family)
MACAVQTRLPAGVAYTTIEIKVNYLRPILRDSGRLRAIGKVIYVGRRLATAEGQLVDEAGRLFAHGTTTCMVLNNAK